MKPPRMLSVYMRVTALVAHLALIVLLIATSTSKLGLCAGLLLFAPLPGMLRGSRYVHAWASMLLVVYCALLLANGYAQTQTQSLMFLLAGLAAIDFTGMVMYVRFGTREAEAQRRQAP
ncbi:DUF2069 domain-containing protein [Solimonas terrae]|uniref:DUF2069 domain-containing protein n=1 Tax=Solimonas terrae TaxID=1396819 RepID=A0A6M2BYJ7_9GAMM|nr:DUF2069 domain-containing protein [Solimonas terrae]NGY06857.1 DUF2069 domain-containing protein [Solimonas terrae]